MYQNLRFISEGKKNSKIMLSAPCTMCQAFVWHLLLARQINLKIFEGKKKKQERFWDSLCPSSGFYPGWNESSFVLGGSGSPENFKDAFSWIDFDLSTIKLWGEKIHPVLCSWQVDESIKYRSRYLAKKCVWLWAVGPRRSQLLGLGGCFHGHIPAMN